MGKGLISIIWVHLVQLKLSKGLLESGKAGFCLIFIEIFWKVHGLLLFIFL
jgi:hypothetical protein